MNVKKGLPAPSSQLPLANHAMPLLLSIVQQEHLSMPLCEVNSAAAAAVVVILAATAAAVAASPAVPTAAEENDDQDDDPERAVTTVAEHSVTLSPCSDFSSPRRPHGKRRYVRERFPIARAIICASMTRCYCREKEK